MEAQGTAVVNTGWFADVTAHINACDVCADLQALVTKAMASIQAEITAIQGQLSSLLPLTTIPHDLGSVIAWITAAANPAIKAYATCAAQLEQTLAAVAALVSAITSAASRIVNCHISVPTIA